MKLALAMLLTINSVMVNAQNNTQEITSGTLEEVTVVGELSLYSATKSDTPILETARSISIENEQQLRDIGAIELADAYTYSAGVTGETFGFSTRGDWIRVRGLDVPQYHDSLQSLFSNYNNTRPEVYTLEQVEILKGPASVLYGQGSPGGIVNVVSKRPDAGSDNEFVLSFGDNSYVQAAIDINGQLDEQGKWLYRIIGLTRDAETQVDFVEDNVNSISPSLSYQPNEDTTITLLLNSQDTEADSGAQFLPISGTLLPGPNGEFIASNFFAGEPEFSQYDGSTRSASLLADHRINDVWSMQLTARKTEGELDYSQAWVAFAFSEDRYVYNADGSLYGDGLVPRSFYQSDASSEQSAIDLRFRASLNTGKIEHEIMLGGQYQDVTTEDDAAYAYGLGYDFATGGPDAVLADAYWINVFNPVYGNVPSQDIIDLFFFDAAAVNVKDQGLYVNDQMTFGNWHYNLGLRYDDVENSTAGSEQGDSETSFATGLLYAFDNGVSPYISYAESFESVVGLDVITNTTFTPQRGEQIEVGVKVSLASSPSYFTLAYFDIEQSNLLSAVSTQTVFGQTQVGGIDTVTGWEFESKFQFGDVSLEANASKLETQTADGFSFASVPDDQASLWLGYQQPSENGLRAGLGVRYVGSSFGGADVIETPAYTLVDAMLSYTHDDWSVRLNARNLADKEYQSTCLARGDCFQGERRTIIGTLSYSF